MKYIMSEYIKWNNVLKHFIYNSKQEMFIESEELKV